MLFMVEEILSRAGIELDSIGYRYINLGGRVVYIMGYVNILDFGQDTMVFDLSQNKKLVIAGVDMDIAEMDDTGVIIRGSIRSIEVM